MNKSCHVSFGTRMIDRHVSRNHCVGQYLTGKERINADPLTEA